MIKGFASLILLCLFHLLSLKAQPLDSVLSNSSPVPFLSLDSRNTNIKETPVRMFGIKLGLQWAGKYRFGFGHYRLTSRLIKKVSYKALNQKVRSRLRFRYYTIFGEFRFLNNKKWTINGTAHIGLGQKFLSPTNRPALPRRINQKTVFLLVPHVSGTYKIISWLGISGGVGYRKILAPNLLRTDNLNGGVIAIGIQVFPFALYKAVFNKN